jgi:hypothetical protein
MKTLLTLMLVSATSVGAQAQESRFVESLRCVGGPFGMQLPLDARQIRSIGPLVRETVAEVEPWEGYTATRKTLHFEGLELGVIVFSNDPSRLMITSAEVSSPKWNTRLPFKIRQPISAALARLGEHAQGDESLKQTYASEGDALRFRTADGLVVGLSYSCYSG